MIDPVNPIPQAKKVFFWRYHKRETSLHCNRNAPDLKKWSWCIPCSIFLA